MKTNTAFLLACHLLLAIPALFSQGLTAAQIDSVVNKAMATMPLAGIAVAVVADGHLVHAKGYGVASVESGKKVDENTLFAIASNSKAFTTMALAILVDDGKLSWDDRVVSIIPEFTMYDPYVAANFTIRDLLTHRSGLGLGAGDLMFFPDGSDFTVADVLKSFQYQEPVSAFRTKYDYDNLLYVVGGEVVARVSGMSWADFVEQKIMVPIGMNRSKGVYQRVADKSNVAFPHAAENGKLRQLQPYLKNDESLGAAGGIYASVKDLSNWMLLHLNKGKYGPELSEEMVSEATHNQLWKPYTIIGFDVLPEPPYKTHFSAYGLGWFLQDRAGYVTAEHTGGLPGMLSRTILIPELDVGVVVLTNTDPGGSSYWTVAMEIADSYLGVTPTDWISWAEKRILASQKEGDSVVSRVWDTAKSATPVGLDMKSFVGTYNDDWFGAIKVWLKNGQLWMRSVRSPKLTGRMFYYRANTFAVKWEYTDMPCDAFAMFTLDENGDAVGLKMKGISPNIDFSFDFHDLDLKRIPEEQN
jgi:CubicO group peptidase (beta-lactamase class C family)